MGDDGSGLASAQEIRAYLVDELNLALRRPGMYGGEMSIRLIIDHLLFVERDRRYGLSQVLEERGAWGPTGVTGALRCLLPEDHGLSMASVYAEIARRRGWLALDRVLDAKEHERMRKTVREWASRDRVWSDVAAEFGEPSRLFGGTNPLSGKVLAYATEDTGVPMVFLHLWNGTEPGSEPSWPPIHDEPILLAVRFGERPFADTFTPEGRRLRPPADN